MVHRSLSPASVLTSPSSESRQGQISARVAAFNDVLVKAKTVSYTTAGQSGLHLQSLLEKFGIAEAVMAKSKTLPSGDVAAFVARDKPAVAIQLVA